VIARFATALLFLTIALASARSCLAALPTDQRSPRAAVDELLAADRAFAAVSAKTLLVSGLSAQFDDDVIMTVPGGFARGKVAAVAALAAHPDSKDAHIAWTPVRAGISADARQGFTFGTMVLTRADDSEVPLKYLAYWRKGSGGWRVIVYKRTRRPADAGAAPALMAAALPARLVVAEVGAGTRATYAQSLMRVEREFSDQAQVIGLGAAFERYGRGDAINLGGADVPGFLVGPKTIARHVAAGQPAGGSTVSWAADEVIVADSGDLGVTIGMIRRNATAAGDDAAPVPFFTVWRRNSPGELWTYIAE